MISSHSPEAHTDMALKRRTDLEPVQTGDYYDAKARYYDQNLEMTVVKVFCGDCYLSEQPREMFVTILGSCVAACVRDTTLGIGGMNHFLLPGTLVDVKEDPHRAARFGMFAMEKLINGVLSAGGRKDRLEIKVFGGGNVTGNTRLIGTQNAAFVRDFLKREGYSIAAQDLEGTLPRRVHYFPATGQVMVRRLQRKEDLRILEKEAQFARSLRHKPLEGDVELFI